MKGYNENIERDTVSDYLEFHDSGAHDVYQNRFKELMRRAARQADVVVPVIAGPTIVGSTKWATHTIRSEWSTKISSVIITKRDLIRKWSQFKRQIPQVAQKCEIPGREHCILVCDTLQGMATMRLQLLLDSIELNAPDPIPPTATAETNNYLRQETEIVIAGINNDSNPYHRVSLCSNWYYSAAPN